MLTLILWGLLYNVVVAASIILLGNPLITLGALTPKSLLSLLFDWQFLLGGILALCARFIFVIINNHASREPAFADAHLTITAILTTTSVLFIVAANHFLLHEQLSVSQIIGGVVIMLGVFLMLR